MSKHRDAKHVLSKVARVLHPILGEKQMSHVFVSSQQIIESTKYQYKTKILFFVIVSVAKQFADEGCISVLTLGWSSENGLLLRRETTSSSFQRSPDSEDTPTNHQLHHLFPAFALSKFLVNVLRD